MSHSKGPFSVDYGAKATIIKIMGNEGYDHIADINTINPHAEGNAALLAAAPALYGSLRSMVGLVESIIENNHVQLYKGDRESIKLAKIAISTAKGEGV